MHYWTSASLFTSLDESIGVQDRPETQFAILAGWMMRPGANSTSGAALPDGGCDGNRPRGEVDGLEVHLMLGYC